MKKLLILMLLLVTIVASGATHSTPYDPGAARDDLSNVTPTTGRTALGLGTMAVATSTDYVATSALALRLDTTNASISNNLDVAGHSTLATASATGAIGAAVFTTPTSGVSNKNNNLGQLAIKHIRATGVATSTILTQSIITNGENIVIEVSGTISRASPSGAKTFSWIAVVDRAADTLTASGPALVSSNIYATVTDPVFTLTLTNPNLVKVEYSAQDAYSTSLLEIKATAYGVYTAW